MRCVLADLNTLLFAYILLLDPLVLDDPPPLPSSLPPHRHTFIICIQWPPLCSAFPSRSPHFSSAAPRHLIPDTPAVRSPCGPLAGAVMAAALLRALILALAASSSPPGQEAPLCFVRCANPGSVRAFTPTGAGDLDPGSCSAHCLREG